MSFALPGLLAVLPLLLGAMLALWTWSARRTRRQLETAMPTPWLGYLLRSVQVGRRRTKRGLVLLGVAGVVMAMARPQWGQKVVTVEQTGTDLVIALDVSRSMLAPDAGGTNRLVAATQGVQRLLENLGGDRVGLLLFAGETYLAAPLTRDHMAVARSLEAANPWAVSEQGSDLGKAITKARECFDRSARGPRTLLVVSDGEQLQGDAIRAAREAWGDGVRVHTAGVGSAEGARLPRSSWERNSYIKNTAGRDVVSRRDEQRLQRIAAAGNGRYVRLADARSDALVAWFEEAVSGLERTTERTQLNEPAEQFQWPLAMAVALLVASGLIRERRRGVAVPAQAGDTRHHAL